MTVSHVIVHHEGGGAPTNDVARMGAKKYSVIVGLTRYVLWCPPEKSFVTTEAGVGHTLQLGLTGNRELHPVTDNDLQLIRDALADARAHGWVTGQPTVTFHGDHEGTACPGRYARQRRVELEQACRTELLPPPRPWENDDMPQLIFQPERPGRPVDPTRPTVAEFRPKDHQIILWNDASIAEDRPFVPGIRYFDLTTRNPERRGYLGWYHGPSGPVVVDDLGRAHILNWS